MQAELYRPDTGTGMCTSKLRGHERHRPVCNPVSPAQCASRGDTRVGRPGPLRHQKGASAAAAGLPNTRDAHGAIAPPHRRGGQGGRRGERSDSDFGASSVPAVYVNSTFETFLGVVDGVGASPRLRAPAQKKRPYSPHGRHNRKSQAQLDRTSRPQVIGSLLSMICWTDAPLHRKQQRR